MPEQHLIASFIRRFLVEELARDRNCSPNTVKSYRDAIRLLLRFLAEQHSTEPTQVTVEQVDDTLLRDFLRDCQERRGNAASTCNQRLAACHSLFRFIGRQVPELIEHAARVQAIPFRKVPVPVMPYLDKAEIEALLAAPDRRRPQGRRDYAMLLFLYNSGARQRSGGHESMRPQADHGAFRAVPGQRAQGESLPAVAANGRYAARVARRAPRRPRQHCGVPELPRPAHDPPRHSHAGGTQCRPGAARRALLAR